MQKWKLTEPPEYFVGVDIGKCRDYTAVAVIERVQVLYPGERDPVGMDYRRETLHTLLRKAAGTL